MGFQLYWNPTTKYLKDNLYNMDLTQLTRPTWLYQLVEIPNLSEIQKELLAVVPTIIPDLDGAPPDYILVPSNQTQPHSPALSQYLNSLGLLGRWVYTAFIVGNQGQSVPMHVDALDWKNRCFGLNIPVLNCKDSYTAFFKADIVRPVDAIRPEQIPSMLCDESTAIEIGRAECDRPYWANISVPHRPIMHHNSPRIIASLRFSPELHDYFTGDQHEQSSRTFQTFQKTSKENPSY